MATNNTNSSKFDKNTFTFRAEYFFAPNDKAEIFDYDNLRNDKIKEISGWAVRDSSLSLDIDEEVTPGVYLHMQIGERRGVSIIIPEQELLKMLADVQRLKKDWRVVTTYSEKPAEEW